MLTADYLLNAPAPVVAIFDEVQMDIVADIAKAIVSQGHVTETAAWRTEMLKNFGAFRGDMLKELAHATKLSEREISALMKQAGIDSLQYDDALYRQAGLSPVPLSRSPALQSVILHGVDNTMALVGNFTKTTATVASGAYTNALDRAFLQVMTGAYDPNKALRMAVNDLARQGFERIGYPAGVKTSLEASVRRAVTTGLNQAVGELTLARATEMDSDLVEVTSHAGARPEHAAWQGKIYSISGSHHRYKSLRDETGYGTGQGLCGWNCYHNFYAYIEGVSTPSFRRDPANDAGRNNDQMYEESQKQRHHERMVRDAKHECVTYFNAAESAPNEELRGYLLEDFQNSAKKLKNRRDRLDAFLDETGRKSEHEREQVAGFGRSMASRASWAGRIATA